MLLFPISSQTDSALSGLLSRSLLLRIRAKWRSVDTENGREGPFSPGRSSEGRLILGLLKKATSKLFGHSTIYELNSCSILFISSYAMVSFLRCPDLLDHELGEVVIGRVTKRRKKTFAPRSFDKSSFVRSLASLPPPQVKKSAWAIARA